MDKFDGSNDRHYVSGFPAYIEKIEEIKKAQAVIIPATKYMIEEQVPQMHVIVMFCAGKDEATGKSWCPDCVDAEPVVTKVINSDLGKDIIFVYVNVGGRDFWKDPKCVFRTDKRTLLTSVPTMIKRENNVTTQTLREVECTKKALVALLFESEFAENSDDDYVDSDD